MTSSYIWHPGKSHVTKANVTDFMKRHEIPTVEDLIQRTTTGIEWFWDTCTHETKISWFEPYTNVLDQSAGFERAEWFQGGTINIVHNCVDRYATNKKHMRKVAVRWQGECGAERSLTYAELHAETNRVANYLESVGVGTGDFVGLYLPMLPELVPVFMAILKIGAVVVPVFSGFGADAAAVRFENARVKVVFTADGTLRKGQNVALKQVLDEALARLPSVIKCVVVQRLFLKDVPMVSGRDVFYQDVIPTQSPECETEELESEATSMVIYTSGTTGKPKGTVHTHAGVLAQVAKEFYFHMDIKPGDVFFWVTDIGWMMGPWEIIGTLHFGNTLVIMEGAPVFPKADRVLTLCDRYDVTHLGLSPTLVRLFMRENDRNMTRHKLKKLRMFGSTGEPWDEDSYSWLFHKIGKGKLPIMNISGGTEIMGCHLAPLIVRPLKPCSLQGPALGMCVDVYTEAGYSAPADEVGYLVCKKPAPSMTKGFLHDWPRYIETYFSKFKGIWNHGDWAVRDADGQWFLRGRADDTIKVAGKRTGPAEIETVFCDHPLVSEACAIGVPDELKGETVVCFAVLKPGIGGTMFLQDDLKSWVAEKLGKVLSPKEVHFVSALPKTRSGKIVRGTIKRKYLGSDLGDLSSVENPDLLEKIPTVV